MVKRKSFIISIIVVMILGIAVGVGIEHAIISKSDSQSIIGTYSLNPNSIDETKYLAIYKNDNGCLYEIYNSDDTLVAKGDCEINGDSVVLLSNGDSIYANVIFNRDSIWYISQQEKAVQIERASDSAITVEK